MTKRQCIALADVLRAQQPATPCEFGAQYYLGARREWESLRDALADFCGAQNPRFDRTRWLGYIAGTCGPNDGAVRKD